jgi:hypothetical protein
MSNLDTASRFLPRRAALFAALAFAAPFTSSAARPANTLSPEEAAQRFELLFDGKTLGRDWRMYQDADFPDANLPDDTIWRVFPEDSSFGKIRPRYSIHTGRAEKNFDVRFDFRFPDCNYGESAFQYRMSTVAMKEGPPMASLHFWLAGPEAARPPSGGMFNLYQETRAGAPYHDCASGQWNAARVLVVADSVEHWLNGVRVLAFNIGSADFRRRYAEAGLGEYQQSSGGKAHPMMRAGAFGFLGTWAGGLRIRDFRIRVFDPLADIWSVGLASRAVKRGPAAPGKEAWTPVLRIGSASGLRLEGFGRTLDLQGRAFGAFPAAP